MVFAKLVSNKERYDEVSQILREVFVNELEYDEKLVLDISNQEVFHVILYDGLKEDKAIASGRLEIINDRAYIKWIAVKKTYRNKKYGDMILRILIDKAKNLSIPNIYAIIPKALVEIFKKIGFDYPVENMKDYINYNEKDIIMKYNNQALSCYHK